MIDNINLIPVPSGTTPENCITRTKNEKDCKSFAISDVQICFRSYSAWSHSCPDETDEMIRRVTAVSRTDRAVSPAMTETRLRLGDNHPLIATISGILLRLYYINAYTKCKDAKCKDSCYSQFLEFKVL